MLNDCQYGSVNDLTVTSFCWLALMPCVGLEDNCRSTEAGGTATWSFKILYVKASLWIRRLSANDSNCSCWSKVMTLVLHAHEFWLHENRFFYHKHDWIATKLARDGPQTGLHPGCAQGHGQGQRSHDTDTFVISWKSLFLAGKWLERYQTCTWWFPAQHASRVYSRSRLRSKVTWYGHFCDVTKCLLYSTVSHSVSTCAYFMKHHYTLLPV